MNLIEALETIIQCDWTLYVAYDIMNIWLNIFVSNANYLFKVYRGIKVI